MPFTLKSIIPAHDGKGQAHRILVFENQINAGFLSDSGQMKGMKQLKTDSGNTVTALGDGKYQILETGEVITANDPSQGSPLER
jgi:hypothetical protein